MRRAVLTIIFLSLLIVSFGQQDSLLQKRLQAFASAIHKEDVDNLPDYFHDKMFITMSKQDMRTGYREMLNAPMFSVHHDSLIVRSISPVFNIQDTSYARVNARMKLIMIVKFPPEKMKTAEARRQFLDQFLANMKQQFRAEELFIEKDDRAIMYVPAPMVAIKNNINTPWTFFPLDAADVVEKSLSKQVIHKLASYQ